MNMGDHESDVPLEAIELLSYAKSRAESGTKFAKALVVDGEITTAQLRELQLVYDEARSEVNAGLDRLAIEIESSQQTPTDTYTRVAETAARHVSTFLDMSEAYALGTPRSPLAAAAVGLLPKLAKAFIDVWKQLRSESSSRRVALVHRIEALKWRDFSEVA
jgi:hypothetical protein